MARKSRGGIAASRLNMNAVPPMLVHHAVIPGTIITLTFSTPAEDSLTTISQMSTANVQA